MSSPHKPRIPFECLDWLERRSRTADRRNLQHIGVVQIKQT